jgi:hypothetical protein
VRGLFSQHGIIAICRQKCVFARFKVPAGLGGRASVAAARVFATNGSPFRETGILISRQADQFGIWWWDQAWVDVALGASGHSTNATLIPEPFFKQAGLGPQIVRSGTGYSSQVWDNGFLLADQWTKALPNSDEWADFLRVAEQNWVEVPAVSASPYISSNPYLASILSSVSAQRWGRMAAGVAAACLVCVTLFLLGQSIRLTIENNHIKQQLAALGPQSQSQTEAYKAQVRALASLNRELNGAQPASALQATQEILTPFGYKLSRFAFDEKQATFDLPVEASVGVDLVAEELESSPYFSQVEPMIDRARNRLVFTMNIDRPVEPRPGQGPK